MKYTELPEDVRAELESKKMCAVRYSSAADKPRDSVDDAMLLGRGTTMATDLLDGYTVHKVVSPWFDFVAEGKSDEEAMKMAREAAEMWDAPSAA
jgi:hypothetical protein